MPTILELWGVRRVQPPPGVSTRQRALAHYELRGVAIPLEGESLVPYLPWRAGAPAVPLVHMPRRQRCVWSQLPEATF